MTIEVRYSCPSCGLVDQRVPVPERLPDQNVVQWMETVCIVALAKDHAFRSPSCSPADNQLHDIKIPLTGRPNVGGPVAH